jgi:hypothetical protein
MCRPEAALVCESWSYEKSATANIRISITTTDPRMPKKFFHPLYVACGGIVVVYKTPYIPSHGSRTYKFG